MSLYDVIVRPFYSAPSETNFLNVGNYDPFYSEVLNIDNNFVISEI